MTAPSDPHIQSVNGFHGQHTPPLNPMQTGELGLLAKLVLKYPDETKRILKERKRLRRRRGMGRHIEAS